jgi:sporulation protein YlmC with PRC-barrel domain
MGNIAEASNSNRGAICSCAAHFLQCSVSISPPRATRDEETVMNRVGAPQMLSALTVAGDSVRNANGDDLGRIEDLVIDVQTGRVNYAVLSFGGYLGVSGRLFAVPWEALERDAESEVFILDVEKAALADPCGTEIEYLSV